MTRRFPQVFWGLVALALAVALGAAFTALAMRGLRGAGNEISVTGSAKRPVRADFAIWRTQVAVQAGTQAEGVALVQAATERVRAFLREQGLPDSAVTVRPLESYPIPLVVDGRETGGIAAYRVSRQVEARTPDVDRVTRTAEAASRLLTAGVPVIPQPPEYLFTALGEIRAELLAEATRDAQARAAAIASSTANVVGPVRNARMGVFQITPRNSTDVSDYGINDLSSVEKEVTAVVRVSFAVE